LQRLQKTYIEVSSLAMFANVKQLTARFNGG
jgi:hypothetical protein